MTIEQLAEAVKSHIQLSGSLVEMGEALKKKLDNLEARLAELEQKV